MGRFHPRDPLDGLGLYAGSLPALWEGRRERPRLFVTPNLDHWRLLHRSPALRRAYRAAAVRVNDSRFLNKALWRGRAPTLPGSDLALRWLESAAAGTRVLIVGCPPGVEAFVRARRPDLAVHGVEPSRGYAFKRAERRALAALAADLAPEIVFVCTGAPQSEVVAHQLLRTLETPCDILCCGAALQFAAGLKARSPVLLQRLGLEWSWRLAREPHTRLRYMLDAVFLATHALRLRRLAPSPSGGVSRSPPASAVEHAPRPSPGAGAAGA